MTFDLFCELGANNEQLDFKIIYGIAKEGIAKYEENDDNNDITPLLDTIIETTAPFEGNENDPLQFQISSLDYDDYIGRLGIGRINKGKIKTGQMVTIVKNDGSIVKEKITKMFVNEGIKKKEVTNYGIGMCLVNITNAILEDQNLILCVSAYSKKDKVYVSVPCIVNINGIRKRVNFPLNKKESISLKKSIKIIKNAISNIEKKEK